MAGAKKKKRNTREVIEEAPATSVSEPAETARTPDAVEVASNGDNVKDMLAALIALSNQHGELIKVLQDTRAAKKHRNEDHEPAEDGDDSDGEDDEAGEKKRSWQYRSFSAIGNTFYRIVKHPHKHTLFREFCADPDSILAECPPLLGRLTAMRTRRLLAGPLRRVLEAITGGKSPPEGETEPVIIGELVSMYMIVRTNHQTTPLRIFLALADMKRGEAMALSETELKSAVIESEVTPIARELARGAAWMTNFPLGEDFVSGEAITNRAAYRRTLEAACGSRSLESLASASRPSPGLLGGSSVSELYSRHQSASVVGGPRSTTSNPGQYGQKVPIWKRCMKCGREGHKMGSCNFPPHPRYDPADNKKLLDLISRGEVTPP